MEHFEVKLCCITGAGWYEGFKTPDGVLVDALETTDKPEDVIDYLDSYGIHEVDYVILGASYVYY